MSGLINDFLRTLIAYGIRVTGLFATLAQRVRVAEFHRRQQQLRVKYAIDDQTPVLSYGRETIALINRAAAGVHGQVQFALTSGSTGTPKRILFTKSRLHYLKSTFTDFFVRCCWAFSLRQTSLYVFSSLIHDQSLTSMLLSETRFPSYFSTLQAPYRVQSHPALRWLASNYGATAVRLWILVIANPGVLYSTNPSTISTFLDDLATRWLSSSKLVRDWHYQPQLFDKSLHRIARRLCARGAARRIARIAKSEKPLALAVCVPAVATYICWTGGYVQPFLKRLATYLPPNRYRLIPMYSMSTETVETMGCIVGQSVTFVPLASDVYYEFIHESEDDLSSNILQPAQLHVGHTYSLIVSDNYGLRRYQTADLFLCEGQLFGLPQLTFVRRKNLEYSFTGEKLTEQQVHSAFQSLRDDIPELAQAFMTVVPSQPADEPVPHYKLVIVSESQDRSEDTSEEIAERCDEILAEINCEYKSKRETGRLGAVRLVRADRNSFLRRLNREHASSWETQFKFLPLYRQTWESSRMSERCINDHSSLMQWQTVSTETR
jgi:hypothetical protein